MPPATFFYEKNEAFEKLASGSDAIFKSRTRFLVFAASVGFRRDHWVENHDKNGEMRWNYITQNQRLSVIAAALAYGRTRDDDAIIKREVVDEPGDNLDNLISFIQSYRNAEKSKDRMGVLEQIENEVSSFDSSE